MLWVRRWHEPLEKAPWDEERARRTIRAIARDAEERFDPRRLWPVHPLDEAAGPSPAGIYFGAAGVLWALHYLGREGAGEAPAIDLASAIGSAHAAYLAAPDSGEAVPSLLVGEAGILLVAERLAPSAERSDRLHRLVLANVANPALELLWGAPGTLYAALHMHERTGEERWRGALMRTVDHLFSEWRSHPGGAFLWTQHLYGEVLEYLGAAHGFAGNAHALLRAGSLLDATRRREVYRRCAETALRTATVEGARANWPAVAGEPGRSDWRVQWCHGAPGVIASLATVPRGFDGRLDALLEAGGELTWQAGPLEKGPGLCHGTAGNGHAFLKLHRRTGDGKWLERARAFAMHAMGQWERQRARHGTGRYTLWTGDLGLAVHLWDCIRGEAAWPILDVL